MVTIMLLCLQSSLVLAQNDPGLRDSIIIEGLSADSGATTVKARIWVVSDDSIAFYNLPVTWSSVNNSVHPRAGGMYYPPLSEWDVIFDSVLVAEHFVRQIGLCYIFPVPDTLPDLLLITGNQRVNCWDMVFDIDPGAPPQTVVLDTMFDSRNRSASFGLNDGLTEFTPAVLVTPIVINSINHPCIYTVGDINGSGDLNSLDVTYGVSFLKGGAPPPYDCNCQSHGNWYVAGDVNGSCSFNGLDVSYLISYFRDQGPTPASCTDCPSAQ